MHAGEESTLIFEHVQIASAWEHHNVSLDRWTGKTVRLKFVSDAGPRDNSTTDHSHWGDVRIAGPAQAQKAATKPVDFMTWVNERDFTARSRR